MRPVSLAQRSDVVLLQGDFKGEIQPETTTFSVEDNSSYNNANLRVR